MSLRNLRLTRVYGCVDVGHSSSSVVIGIDVDRVEDISFPDHISGPPRGWRSAVRRVAMLRAITEGQRGRPPRWEWKASSNGKRAGRSCAMSCMCCGALGNNAGHLRVV